MVSEEKKESTNTSEVEPETVEAEEVEADATEATDVVEPNEIDVLTEKLEGAEDQLLRAQAEMANMRSRFQKEREGLVRYQSQDLAKELLPALDNLERALATDVQEEQALSLKKGIEMVHESLKHALTQQGIVEIASLDQAFDPNLHQAVQTVPAVEGQESDVIVQVLQKGYTLHERVLRPAMVVVSQ